MHKSHNNNYKLSYIGKPFIADQKKELCTACKGSGFTRNPGFTSSKEIIMCQCKKEGLEQRKSERVKSLFKNANIPPIAKEWSFETYPVTADRDALNDVRGYVEDSTKTDDENKRGLYLSSEGGGRCKTGLAISCLRYVMSEGVSCLFLSEDELFGILNDAYAAQKRLAKTIYDDTDDREIDRYDASKSKRLMLLLEEIPWVVIDEIGLLSTSSQVITQFYHIVNHRYNAGLYTIFTSNLALSQLFKHWGGSIAARVINRLGDYCYEVPVGGPDQRSAKVTRE